MKEWKECSICHRIFKSTNERHIYCSHKCLQEAKNEQRRNKIKIRPIASQSEFIEEINRKALAEHLSYGQYVAKYGI